MYAFSRAVKNNTNVLIALFDSTYLKTVGRVDFACNAKNEVYKIFMRICNSFLEVPP